MPVFGNKQKSINIMGTKYSNPNRVFATKLAVASPFNRNFSRGKPPQDKKPYLEKPM